MFFKHKTIEPVLKPEFQPFVIGNQCGIVGIELIDKRDFYDTKWRITTITSSEKSSIDINKMEIVRYDSENMLSLIDAIKSCKSMDDIKALNMVNKIYYD